MSRRPLVILAVLVLSVVACEQKMTSSPRPAMMISNTGVVFQQPMKWRFRMTAPSASEAQALLDTFVQRLEVELSNAGVQLRDDRRNTGAILLSLPVRNDNRRFEIQVVIGSPQGTIVSAEVPVQWDAFLYAEFGRFPQLAIRDAWALDSCYGAFRTSFPLACQGAANATPGISAF